MMTCPGMILNSGASSVLAINETESKGAKPRRPIIGITKLFRMGVGIEKTALAARNDGPEKLGSTLLMDFSKTVFAVNDTPLEYPCFRTSGADKLIIFANVCPPR